MQGERLIKSVIIVKLIMSILWELYYESELYEP